MDKWSQDYNRAEKVDSSDGCNKMHVVGITLCVLLKRCSELGETYYLHAALGHARERVLLRDKQLQDYNIQELQNLVTVMQLEFGTLYRLQESGD